MAARRQFSREFKLEAVRLVNERGVSVAQAARDLELHQTVLRSWIREFASDPQQVFPGKGVMKPELLQFNEDRADRAQGPYRTRDEVKADVFDYIERFYNPTRRHSTLGYVSPIESEKAQRA